MTTYDNNANRPTVSVYTPISFTNPDSPFAQSRLSINYFNRMMQISIAPRVPATPNESYPTYSKNGQVSIYITAMQAKMLHDGFEAIMSGKSDHHNVCIETKNGLFMLNDGIDKGTEPYAAIFYIGKGSGTTSVIHYQFKRSYELPCDYDGSRYDIIKFPDMEVQTLLMTLEAYYQASSYAIAASVAESSMYRNNNVYEALKAIAGKVGVVLPTGKGSSGGGGYSILGSNQNASSEGFDATTALTGGISGVATKKPTFDDMINSSTNSWNDD